MVRNCSQQISQCLIVIGWLVLACSGSVGPAHAEKDRFGVNDYSGPRKNGAVALAQELQSSARLQQLTGTALHIDRLAALHGWHEVLRGNASGLSAQADAWLAPLLHASAQYLNLTVFTQATGFDGREAWTRDLKGVVWAEGSDVGRSLAINQNARDTYAIWSPNADGAIVTSVGTREEEGTTFVFDTGAFNVIDPAVAREIGVSAAGHQEGSGPGAEVAEVQFARVNSLKLGNAELQDQLFATLPLRHGFAVAADAPFDGLIGWEVLSRFVTSIDYVAKTVTLRRGTAPQNGVLIPFVFRGTDPEFACTIDDVASRCLVDTGSGSTLDIMTTFVASHPSVVPRDATAPGMNGYGAGGGDIGRLGRLRSFGFGGFTLNDLITGFSEAKAGVSAKEGIGANVGGGVWSRFAVTFDYQHQTMTLAPNSTFANRDEYERAGLYVIARDGQLIVADVRARTPSAKAGLRKDDVISTVDGHDASQMTPGDLRAKLRGPSGTIVRFGVKRGSSAEVEIAVRLADFV